MGRPLGKQSAKQSAPSVLQTKWTRRDRSLFAAAGFLASSLLAFAAWQIATPRNAPVPPAELAAHLPDPLTDRLLSVEDRSDNSFSGKEPRTEVTDRGTSPAALIESELEIPSTTSRARKGPAAAATVAKVTAPRVENGAGIPRQAPDALQPPPETVGTAPPAPAAALLVQSEKGAAHEELTGIEAEDYDENGADDFACPVPWLQNSRMTERVKYLSSLQNLLKAGWEEKPTALETARGYFETARGLCADDPRLPYAFGLVLWKHDRHPEARREWETATRTGTQPFLPALTVLAWATLMDDELTAGFAAIEGVTEAVVRPSGAYPTAAQRTHATLFLGRAFGFFKGPGRSPELIDHVLLTEKKLLARLPEELRKTFEQGETQAARRYEVFLHLAERPYAEVVAGLQREQQRLEDEIATLRQDVKKCEERQRQIPREARSRSTELARESSELEDKIGQWALGIDQGNALAANLSQPRQIFAGYATESKREWVEEKGKGKDKDDGRWETVTRTVAKYRNENPQEIQTRLQEREQVLTKLKSRSQELVQFDARLKEIPREKYETAKALRQERLDNGRFTAATRHKIAELAIQERDLRKNFTTPAEMRKRMTSLAPYVPWAPETDREGLSASYRQKPAKPASPPSSRDRRPPSR